MDKEKLITDIIKLALDFWTMNLHSGTFESNLRTLIDKHEEAINYSQCCESDSEQYCECDKPTLGDNVWTCGCGKPFKKKDK